VRTLALLAALCVAAPAFAETVEPTETPILVPSPIPVGFLLAWKPMVLSIRSNSGPDSHYGSDTFQPFRGLFRYTNTLLSEKLMARAEIEGGEFQTDPEHTTLGSDGYDVTLRATLGIAQRIAPGLVVTGSAGLLTRYQRGRAEGGAPRLGFFGAMSNADVEYRVAPLVSLSFYLEGAITPIPYGADQSLGELSDASEFRIRGQVSIDVATNVAIDFGYDYTRWHATFSQGTNTPNQALLVATREHALTLGVRWKP
jgi:opacity protein-like surface antigen